MGNPSQADDKDFSLDSTASSKVKDIVYDVEIDPIAMPYQGDLKKSGLLIGKNIY